MLGWSSMCGGRKSFEIKGVPIPDMRCPSTKTGSTARFSARTKLLDGCVVSDGALLPLMSDDKIWLQILAAVVVVAFMTALTLAMALVVLWQ